MARLSGTHLTRRTWSSPAVFTLAALLLFASTPAALGQTVVHFGYWNVGADYDQLVRNLIDQFNASQNEIQVIPDPISGNVREQILVRMASGIAPDTTWWAGAWYPEMIENGGFVDLTSFVDPEDLQDFFPPLLDGMRWKGGLYGIALDGNPTVLYYNKDHFARAGVGFPDEAWTWDSLLDAARKTTVRSQDRTTQWGITAFYGTNDINNAYGVIWSNGGELYDSWERPTESWVTSEAVVESLQWIADLRFVYQVAPGVGEYEFDLGEKYFINGQSAMTFAHMGPINALREADAFEWDVAVLPLGRAGRSTRIGSAGFSVLSSSEHPEAAWKVLQWFSSKDALPTFTRGRAIPGRISLAEEFLYPELPPANQRAFIDSLLFGRTMPVLDMREPRLTPVFHDALKRIYDGVQAPAVAMSQIKPVLDGILNE